MNLSHGQNFVEASFAACAARLRERLPTLAWEKTPLGAPQSWSGRLQSLINMVFASAQPMALVWGDELTLIHNDAFAALLGGEDPAAFGKSWRESCWREAAPPVEPLIAVLRATGTAQWLPRLRLRIERAQGVVEVHISLALMPYFDDEGHTIAFVALCGDVTREVLAERRLRLLRSLSTAPRLLGDGDLGQLVLQRLKTAALDIPFALLYRLAPDGPALVASVGCGEATPAPRRGEALRDREAWREIERGEPLVVMGCADLGQTGGPWHDPVEKMVLLPLKGVAQRAAFGALALATNPCCPLDADYLAYLTDVAGWVAGSLDGRCELADSDLAAAATDTAAPNRNLTRYLASEWVGPLAFLQHALRKMLESGGPPLTVAQRQHLETAKVQVGHLLTTVHELQQAITEEQESVEAKAAGRMRRLKEEFLAIVSHELRTPLNVIRGHSELLALTQPLTDELSASLQAIMRNVDVQTRLIDDVLDVATLGHGTKDWESVPVNLAAVVATTLAEVQEEAAARGVALVSSGAALTSNPIVVGDFARLKQALAHVLRNAVKFSAAGGEVAVSLRTDGDAVELAIVDRGIGMHPQFLPYAFEPFRQEDMSSTRAHGGFGLGLAVVRAIVSGHGGSASVFSAGRGQGTTLTLRLPLAGAVAAPC